MAAAPAAPFSFAAPPAPVTDWFAPMRMMVDTSVPRNTEESAAKRAMLYQLQKLSSVDNLIAGLVAERARLSDEFNEAFCLYQHDLKAPQDVPPPSPKRARPNTPPPLLSISLSDDFFGLSDMSNIEPLPEIDFGLVFGPNPTEDVNNL